MEIQIRLAEINDKLGVAKTVKVTPHNDCIMALPHVCLHFFRHLAQKAYIN